MVNSLEPFVLSQGCNVREAIAITCVFCAFACIVCVGQSNDFSEYQFARLLYTAWQTVGIAPDPIIHYLHRHPGKYICK